MLDNLNSIDRANNWSFWRQDPLENKQVATLTVATARIATAAQDFACHAPQNLDILLCKGVGACAPPKVPIPVEDLEPRLMLGSLDPCESASPMAS